MTDADQNRALIIASNTSGIYSKDELGKELRQGEIICGLTQYFFNPDDSSVEHLTHPYAVAVNQDCDLLWDYEGRNGGSGAALDSALFFIAEPAEGKRADIAGDIWRRVITNSNDRYHLLSAVSADEDGEGSGFPSLIIDFKSFFTLPPSDVYAQVSKGIAKRRCRLEMPYREHLQCRAAFYFQRVMLPKPHQFK